MILSVVQLSHGRLVQPQKKEKVDSASRPELSPGELALMRPQCSLRCVSFWGSFTSLVAGFYRCVDPAVQRVMRSLCPWKGKPCDRRQLTWHCMGQGTFDRAKSS